MRFLSFAALFLCCAITLVAAWNKEDHEIFRLRDQLEASEGEGVTFYDFLGIKTSAGQEDVNKAYRKRSRLLHPDKAKQTFIATWLEQQAKKQEGAEKKHASAKGPSKAEIKKAVKDANDRFTRLGLIAKILRGPGRERYDHFLNNGFPRWRGSGYYYARFRPGLGSVLLGLFIVVGGGAHYGALYLSWKRQQDFVGRYVRHARRAAWGDDLGIKGIPNFGETAAASTGPAEKDDMGMASMNRRQRRLQEKENKKNKGSKEGTSTPVEAAAAPASSGPTGDKKRVTAENGKILIVDSLGNVYMEQKNADGETEEYLLDPNEIQKPTIRETALFRLPTWAYRQSVGKALMRIRGETEEGQIGLDEDEDDDTGSDEATGRPKSGSGIVGGSRRRAKRNGRGR